MLDKLEPITLEGKYIILRPPLLEDIEGLSKAASDGEVWNSRFSQFPHPNEIPKYI
jgi:N-acetyltransferase